MIGENFFKELRENRPRGISGLTMTATTTPALTDNKTLNEVVNCLTENIPLQTQGKCEQRNIFEILIRAATQKDSIENTTKVLKNVPTSNDIRYHLEKYSDLTSLEDALNKALQSRLPTGIRQGQQKIAIDFNLIPYYGEPSPLEAPYIYRSQAKNGNALSPKNQPALINPSLCVLVSLFNQKGWLIFYVSDPVLVLSMLMLLSMSLKNIKE